VIVAVVVAPLVVAVALLVVAVLVRAADGAGRTARQGADGRARGCVAAADVVADDGAGHGAQARADGALTDGFVRAVAAAVVRVAGAGGHQKSGAGDGDDRLVHGSVLHPLGGTPEASITQPEEGGSEAKRSKLHFKFQRVAASAELADRADVRRP